MTARAFVANGPAYSFLDRQEKLQGWPVVVLSFWELVDGGPPDKTLA